MKLTAAIAGIVLGVAGAAYFTRLDNPGRFTKSDAQRTTARQAGAQKAIVSQTPNPGWTAGAPVGARIGSNGGSGARGYWEITVFDDGTIGKKWIAFAHDWTP